MFTAHFLLQYTFSKLSVLYSTVHACVCYGFTSEGYVRKIKSSVSHSIGFLSHLNSSSRVHCSISVHSNSDTDDEWNSLNANIIIETFNYRDIDDDYESCCKLLSSVLAWKLITILILMKMTTMTMKIMKSGSLLVDELSASMWHHFCHTPSHHVTPLLAALAFLQSQLGNFFLWQHPVPHVHPCHLPSECQLGIKAALKPWHAAPAAWRHRAATVSFLPQLE